ncbi:unnamed protein product [Rotaria magnacalcarata]
MDKLDDDIATPSTSRSNSVNGDEEQTSLPPSSAPTEETAQSEPLSFNASNHVADHVRATLSAKRATFISSSSSSSSESESEFVNVNTNDLTQDGSASTNANM